VTTNASRWAERGWATRGSRLQTQPYVNRQPQALRERVLETLPELAVRGPRLEWVAPLEQPRPPLREPFAEPRDEAMLGLERLAGALSDFWPTRGPGLGRARDHPLAGRD
jgi:hypothetical protein